MDLHDVDDIHQAIKTVKEHFSVMRDDKIQGRMNISQESKIFHLSTDCRIEVYT